MKKKQFKKIAATIGMSHRSVPYLMERNIIRKDMTEIELEQFAVNKDLILENIAHEYPGFKRLRDEAPDKVFIINKDGVVMNALTARILLPATTEDDTSEKYIPINFKGKTTLYRIENLVSKYFGEGEE